MKYVLMMLVAMSLVVGCGGGVGERQIVWTIDTAFTASERAVVAQAVVDEGFAVSDALSVDPNAPDCPSSIHQTNRASIDGEVTWLYGGNGQPWHLYIAPQGLTQGELRDLAMTELAKVK